MKKTFAGAAIALTLIVPSAAFAESATTTKVNGSKAVLNHSCIQAAVETRDSSIIASQSKFSTAWASALTARKDALKAAWGIEDAQARRTARQAAWGTFDTAMKTARTTGKTERSAAWTKYQADFKACGVNYTVDVAPASESI